MNGSSKPPDADPKRHPDNVARYERWGKWAATFAGVCYVLIWWFDRGERFGPIGDAMGPLTGVLTALALFAAIEGVRLQREELKLQREELAESREVMRDQARAAERSAEVQQRLADAQEALTRRQYESNVRAHYAQIASIESDALQLVARIAEVRHSESSTSDILADELNDVRLRLVKLRQYYERKAGPVIGLIPITGRPDQDAV